MDDEIKDEMKEEMPEPKKEEKASPLADVHQMVTDAEASIESGEKTKNEVIDELVASLQGMKEGENPMGGLGEDTSFELPEEE